MEDKYGCDFPRGWWGFPRLRGRRVQKYKRTQDPRAGPFRIRGVCYGIDIETPALGFPGLSLDRVHDTGAFRVLALAARQRGSGYGVRQSRQNRLQAADHGFEQTDAVPECPVNVGFDRVLS